MNRCILEEINEKTCILAKSPKVHKGGGSTPPPIGGYFFHGFFFGSNIPCQARHDLRLAHLKGRRAGPEVGRERWGMVGWISVLLFGSL